MTCCCSVCSLVIMQSSESLWLTHPLIAAMARLGNDASAEEVRERVIWEVRCRQLSRAPLLTACDVLSLHAQKNGQLRLGIDETLMPLR